MLCLCHQILHFGRTGYQIIKRISGNKPLRQEFCALLGIVQLDLTSFVDAYNSTCSLSVMNNRRNAGHDRSLIEFQPERVKFLARGKYRFQHSGTQRRNDIPNNLSLYFVLRFFQNLFCGMIDMANYSISVHLNNTAERIVQNRFEFCSIAFLQIQGIRQSLGISAGILNAFFAGVNENRGNLLRSGIAANSIAANQKMLNLLGSHDTDRFLTRVNQLIGSVDEIVDQIYV